jgi:hypothetical protein
VIDQDTCVLHTGSNSLDELALYAALKGFDFQVLHPPELIPAVRALADRLGKAADTALPAFARTALPAPEGLNGLAKRRRARATAARPHRRGRSRQSHGPSS